MNGCEQCKKKRTCKDFQAGRWCSCFVQQDSCTECKERNVCTNQGLYDGGSCAAFEKGEPEVKIADVDITSHRLKGDWILRKILSVFDELIEKDNYGNGCTMEDRGLVLIDSGWCERSKLEALLEEEFDK